MIDEINYDIKEGDIEIEHLRLLKNKINEIIKYLPKIHTTIDHKVYQPNGLQKNIESGKYDNILSVNPNKQSKLDELNDFDGISHAPFNEFDCYVKTEVCYYDEFLEFKHLAQSAIDEIIQQKQKLSFDYGFLQGKYDKLKQQKPKISDYTKHVIWDIHNSLKKKSSYHLNCSNEKSVLLSIEEIIRMIDDKKIV